MGIPVEEIVSRFKDEDCVFLLGPSLVRDKMGGPLQSGLIRYFREKQLEIEEDMDSLYSCKKQIKTRAYNYLKEYYKNNSEPTNPYKQLARLPCHLYVSINPDLLMSQALDDYGVTHEFKYYVKGQPPEEVINPTAEKPLLYNLFGCLDSQQSLIFTYDDLIQYMFSIISMEFKLPQNLRDALKSSRYFIFIGFDFEQWYLRLLLNLFLDESKLSIALESGNRTQDKLRTFYAGHYGLEFVDHDVEEYIKGIYDECDRQGLLRSIKAKAQTSIVGDVRELIRKDEIDMALDRLYQFLESMDDHAFQGKGEGKKSLMAELDTHAARLSRVERSLRMGETSRENVGIEKNRIANAVNKIIAEVSAE